MLYAGVLFLIIINGFLGFIFLREFIQTLKLGAYIGFLVTVIVMVLLISGLVWHISR